MASRYADLVERAAISASLLCLVHCLALPLFLAMPPGLSHAFSLPHGIHFAILIFAVPSSLATLLLGHRGHRAVTPLIVGIAGLGLLALGTLALEGTPRETPVTVMGSLSLAFAHIRNWRARHALHRHV